MADGRQLTGTLLAFDKVCIIRNPSPQYQFAKQQRSLSLTKST